MKLPALLACSSLLLAGTVLPQAAAAPEVGSRPSSVTVQPPADAEEVTGTVVTVTGAVSGDRRDRPVRLQLHTPSGWMAVGTPARTDAAGAFTLTVPTDWVYDGDLRVRTPKTDTHRAASSPRFAMAVTPTYRPSGKAGDWRVYDAVARWNPCRTITYRVNTVGAPEGGLEMVHAAIAVLHQANGLRFEYLGDTEAIPFRDDGGLEQSGDAMLDIAWATSEQVDELGGDTIGWGGLWWNNLVAYRGGIALRTDAVLTSDPGPGGTWPNLLIHELGHVVGLDHAETTKQVMYPQIPSSPGRFEAGDFNGLETKGAAEGCWSGLNRGLRVAGPGHASAP